MRIAAFSDTHGNLADIGGLRKGGYYHILCHETNS